MSLAEVFESESREDMVISMATAVGSGGNQYNIVGDPKIVERKHAIAEKLPHPEINEQTHLEELQYVKHKFPW